VIDFDRRASGAGAGPGSGLGAAVELAAIGTALTLCMAWLARIPSWYRDLGAFQGLFAVAFALYAVAVLRLERYAALPRAGGVVLIVAFANRILLAPLPPSLSGDLYRYLWEGRVWCAGANPYALPPQAPALAALRDLHVYPFVNHPHLSTIYPPLGEAGFALVAALAPTVLGFKIWVVLHDLALVGVLMAWSAASRGSPAWALVYAWNPLVLVEFAGTGHNDPTAMLGLALALWLRERAPVASGLALAWGTLVKLAPIVALPFLWRSWPWRARLACLAVQVPGLALFAWATRASHSGLAAYWGQWRNNELAFLLAERALGSFGRARVLTLTLVGGVAVWALAKRVATPRATRAVLGTALVTAPVVHPWYAGWVLIFEPLQLSWPWLLLSGLMILNYGLLAAPAEGRGFHPPLSWRLIEYGLPLALALTLGWRRRDRSASGEARERHDAD
jgi:hypothetical protein